MANIKRLYVFVTSFLSGVGVLFTVVSLATEQWVTSEPIIATTESGLLGEKSQVKYGLFQGTHSMTAPTTTSVQYTMTCLIDKNVCAMLCASSDDLRYDILRGLYNGSTPSDPVPNCPSTLTTRSLVVYKNTLIRATSSDDREFINCGVWISTIVFLCLSVLAGVVSTVLAVYNTVSNPVEVYLSIFGLYIYNAIASFCAVMTMALWGAMFNITVFHDINIYYTLTGNMDSDKRSSLGYSYWVLVIPVFSYIGSIFVLFLRQYLVSKDPGRKIVQQEDSADPGLYLY